MSFQRSINTYIDSTVCSGIPWQECKYVRSLYYMLVQLLVGRSEEVLLRATSRMRALRRDQAWETPLRLKPPFVRGWLQKAHVCMVILTRMWRALLLRRTNSRVWVSNPPYLKDVCGNASLEGLLTLYRSAVGPQLLPLISCRYMMPGSGCC